MNIYLVCGRYRQRTCQCNPHCVTATCQRAMETGPTKSFEDLVPKEYWEFQDVFSKKSFDQLPAQKPWEHVIELTPGSQAFSIKVYPMSPNEQQELDVFLEENLKTSLDTSFKITHGIPSVLCQEEGWQFTICTRLPQTQ